MRESDAAGVADIAGGSAGRLRCGGLFASSRTKITERRVELMLDKRLLRPQTFPRLVIMLLLAVIILSTVTLGGFAVLLYALNHMAEGYEDEYGFHHGVEPRPQGSSATAERIEGLESIEGNWFEATQLKQQPKPASPRAADVGTDRVDNLPSCV